MKILFSSSKILRKILVEKNLEHNSKDLLSLYRKMFGKSKTQGKVQLSKIGKIYENGFKAIHNFNLNIEEHEFVSLLGPSGCGKTTILRMIAGLELISEGKLKIGDVVMNSSLPKERGLAMVFQNYALYPYMTVYENIAFGLKNKTYVNSVSKKLFDQAFNCLDPLYTEKKYLSSQIYTIRKRFSTQINELSLLIRKEKKIGENPQVLKKLLAEKRDILVKKKEYLKTEGNKEIAILNQKLKSLKNAGTNKQRDLKKFKKEIDKYIESIVIWKKTIPTRVEQFAKMVGIQNYLRRKPSALSGGQRQRVALVRAISKDASLFLFDEPLSNLDAKLRTTMRSEIRRLHESLNSTSIFVTHDQIEAMTISDKIVLMNKGYIQQVGTPNELFNYPSNVFVADFIGTPRINLLNAKLTSNNKLKIGKDLITLSLKPKDILKNLKKYINTKVIVGIRPQNIITDKTLVDSSKENVFKGKVMSVESIGHENIITIQSPTFGQLFRIVAGRYFLPKRGDIINFLIDMNTVQLFDSDNGFSISSIPNKATQQARDIWITSEKERIKNSILVVKEKNAEKIQHKIAKYIYSKINPRYAKKRSSSKQEIKKLINDKHDIGLVEQTSDQVGN